MGQISRSLLCTTHDPVGEELMVLNPVKTYLRPDSVACARQSMQALSVVAIPNRCTAYPSTSRI